MPYCLSFQFIRKELETEFSVASCFGGDNSKSLIVDCMLSYNVEAGMLKLHSPECFEASILNVL